MTRGGWSTSALQGSTFTFSNADRTAYYGGTNGNVQSFDSATSGLQYAEVLINANEYGDISVNNSDDSNYFHVDYSGQTYTSAGTPPSGQVAALAFVQGDIVRVCYDPSVPKVWFAINGGAWNGDNTAHNPATGTGGYTIPGAGGQAFYVKAAMSTFAPSSRTLNTGTFPFVYSVPSGATPLAASTNPPLDDGWRLYATGGFTLSNGNKTATQTTGNANCAARGWRNSGKGYFEAKFDTLTGNQFSNVAISSGNGGTWLDVEKSGVVNNNYGGGGTQIATVAPFAQGDTLCFALDYANAKLWVRTNNGNWNNSGTADPSTNTGGIAFNPTNGQYILLYLSAVGDAVTLSARYDDTFLYTAPSGFTAFIENTQTGSVTATSLTAGNAAFGVPALSTVYNFTATPILSAAAGLGQGLFVQHVALLATSFAPQGALLGPPVFSERQGFLASSITVAAAAFGNPAFNQGDKFAATVLASSGATLGTAAIQQTHKVTATSLASGAATLGRPAFAQSNRLTATSLATAASHIGSSVANSTPNLDLTAIDLAGQSAALGATTVRQTHGLDAADLVAQSAALDPPAFGQAHALSVESLAVRDSFVSVPALQTVYAIGAVPLATALVAFGQVPVAQNHVLFITSITTASSDVGQPSVAQKQALFATPITTDHSNVGEPPFGQGDSFSTPHLTSQGAGLGRPSIAQQQNLTAAALATAAASLKQVAISTRQTLAIDTFATGAAAFTTPVISAPVRYQGATGLTATAVVSASEFVRVAAKARIAPASFLNVMNTTQLDAGFAKLRISAALFGGASQENSAQVHCAVLSSLWGNILLDSSTLVKLRPACFLSAKLSLRRPFEVSAMITARQNPALIVAQGNLLIGMES